MIKINLMRSFLNRQKERGWRNINVRGYTDKDNQVLTRGNESIIVVENIYVDASVDLTPQIDALFKRLKNIIERTNIKEIFLPGGGDIPIPDFFKDYCRGLGIRINYITIESYIHIVNYNE